MILEQIGHFTQFPQRVISLVPSMTESLFDLGMGSRVVGVSDYCIYPPQVQGLPRVGGTKNVNQPVVKALLPDLVIANQEENTRSDIEALAQFTDVWLVFPKTIRQVLDDLWQLVHLFRQESAFYALRTLEIAVEYAENRLDDIQPVRVFAPIWKGTNPDGIEWWMTFNKDTYCSDVIRLLGGLNIFADRERRYPLEADLGIASAEETGERDQRYPRVTGEEVRAAQPEIIFLPSEPFEFTAVDILNIEQAFSNTPAVIRRQIYPIDGSLLTWHGTRLGKALGELGQYFP